ncbi:protein kinase [Aureococcus anophagefferens]|nr:protein kinase [Aureococcus anophagefferens]
MIWATEIGDKTFFIAAILAMKHARLVIFLGAVSALSVMTVLAPRWVTRPLMPRTYTHYASALLFFYFGCRMLKDASSMSGSGVSEELGEVEEELGAGHGKKDVEDDGAEAPPPAEETDAVKRSAPPPTRRRAPPMDRYDVGTALGQGQWGVVRKATRRADGVEVAIKVRCAAGSAEGVNFQVLREIKMLRDARHPHVVRLFDVFRNPGGDATLSLVFELLATDLEKVLYDGGGALPANLLISAAGVLKLADFGYARYVADPGGRMSYECCTLWYRPPSLWARRTTAGRRRLGRGLHFAELALRRPVFRGDSETDQLARIFAVLGRPTTRRAGRREPPQVRQFTDARSEDLGALLNATPATPLVARLALDLNARALRAARYAYRRAPPRARAPAGR